MGQESGEVRSDQIKRNIDYERQELDQNIQRLQYKVKDTMDWRSQFRKNPLTLMGVAFGGGILLSTLLGRHGTSSRGDGVDARFRNASPPEHNQGTNYQRHQAMEVWDNIKGAAIGVAATRFKSFLSEAFPGFADEYRRTEQKKPAATAASVGHTGTQ